MGIHGEHEIVLNHKRAKNKGKKQMFKQKIFNLEIFYIYICTHGVLHDMREREKKSGCLIIKLITRRAS